MGLRAPEIIAILLILLLLFGAKRLPDTARAIGQSLKIFKKSVRDEEDDKQAAQQAAQPAQQSAQQPAQPPQIAAASESAQSATADETKRRQS
jgi:sec-independent protein translocase protein TatA